MLFADGLVGALLLFFWVWALFDVIATDSSLVRNLPKGMWIVLVLFLSDIGVLAWILLGRPEGTTFSIGSTRNRPASSGSWGSSGSGWDRRLDARSSHS